MFRIVYVYFKIDENFRPIGKHIVKHVDAESVNEVNRQFAAIRYTHDLAKFTPLNFLDVLEIKEH